MDKVESQYYTVGEAATFFNVTKKTVKKWDDEGKFPNAIGEGRARRYLKVDCEAIKEGKMPDKLEGEVESPELRQAREGSEAAQERLNIKKYDAERLALDNDYESFEQGLADIRSKLAEVDERLKFVIVKEMTLDNERADVAELKEKMEAVKAEYLEKTRGLETDMRGLSSQCDSLEKWHKHHAGLREGIVSLLAKLFEAMERTKRYYHAEGKDFLGFSQLVIDYTNYTKNLDIQPMTPLPEKGVKDATV